MKKILLACALSLATAASGEAVTKHGFYVGAGIAGLAGTHDANISYPEPAAFTETNSFGFSRYTIGADIMIGYMATINNFMLGLEVDYMFGNINRTNTTQRTATSSHTAKADSTGGAWGVGVKFGYHCIDRVLPYIRLGIENRRFKIYHFSTDAGVPSVLEINSSARKTAFTPGVGMDFKLNKNLALGLEYRVAFFGSINKSGFNPGVPRTVNFNLKPRVSTGLLSLKYIWGN